jgi:ankyrin repeat protein
MKNIVFRMVFIFLINTTQLIYTMYLTNEQATKFLFDACKENYSKDVIAQLIASGADVNGENEAKDRPLHIACMFGNIGIIKTLLEHGADINFKMRASCTPLHCAVLCNRGHIVHYLLQKGADVDMQDKRGRTAFDLACNAQKKYIMGFFPNQSREEDGEMVNVF